MKLYRNNRRRETGSKLSRERSGLNYLVKVDYGILNRQSTYHRDAKEMYETLKRYVNPSMLNNSLIKLIYLDKKFQWLYLSCHSRF